MIRAHAHHGARESEERYSAQELQPDHQRAIEQAIAELTEMFFEDVEALFCLVSARIQDQAVEIHMTEYNFMASYLPPQQMRRYVPSFAKKFLTSLIVVGWKFCAPGLHRLSSVAEELAMRAIIRRAEDRLREGGEQADFSSFWGVVFKDGDFEYLFDPSMDGIEKCYETPTVNLRIQDWFKPFQGVKDSAHPYLSIGEDEGGHGESKDD